MKKIYNAPTAEKIKFDYTEQVVASVSPSPSGCKVIYNEFDHGACTDVQSKTYNI